LLYTVLTDTAYTERYIGIADKLSHLRSPGGSTTDGGGLRSVIAAM